MKIDTGLGKSLTLTLSFGCLLLLAACGEPPAKKESQKASDPKPSVADCIVTMGWDPWEPYMYLTPGDTVSGLDVEIIQAIAKEAGCKVDFLQADWMTLLRHVENGDVDFVAGASITDKRKEYAMFSKSYREENFVLYVRTGQKANFPSTVQEILEMGKKIGVTTDYLYGEEIAALRDSEELNKLFVNSAVGEANYFNLMQHNVDAIIDDPFVGTYTIKRKGLSDQIEQLPILIHSGEVHLMFSMKSVDHTVVERFNAALERIKQNNTYQQILNKYLR